MPDFGLTLLNECARSVDKNTWAHVEEKYGGCMILFSYFFFTVVNPSVSNYQTERNKNKPRFYSVIKKRKNLGRDS